MAGDPLKKKTATLGAVFGETSSDEDSRDPFWNNGDRQSSSSSAEIQLSLVFQRSLPSLLQSRLNCWPQAELSASAQRESAATSDSFPAAAGRSDVVGESSSDRDPLQMPLRAFVRSILLLFWTGHGWSQFLLLVSRNAALFTRTVSSSIESHFFVYHTSRQ